MLAPSVVAHRSLVGGDLAGLIEGLGDERACLQVFVGSPLTDSNRRPPPYHQGSAATGRNPRQRFWLVSAVFGVFRFATGCQWLRPLGSINAPYRWPESL